MRRNILKSVIRATIEKSRRDSDSGASLITSILLIPIVLFAIISIVDAGLFFMTDSTMSRAARDGAETATTLGGTGLPSTYAPTERFYPQRMSQTDLTNATNNWGLSIRNTPEFMVGQSIDSAASVYGATVTNITCKMETRTGTTTRANRLGDRAECRVSWRYDTGLPVSAFGLIGDQDRVSVGSSTADYIVSYDASRGGPRP